MHRYAIVFAVTAGTLLFSPAQPPPRARVVIAATSPELLRVKKDFKVELVYSVPRETQGSWVCLAIDSKGRLYTSDQYGKLYRVTPPAVGAAEPVSVEAIPVEIGEAQGLLWAFDALYVVVNCESGRFKSGLYRVTDSDNDDTLDRVEMLREIDGSGEHGPHAVILGPDGNSLFLCIGNHTKLTHIDASRVPRVWAEDQVIDRMWDPRGHARGILAPGGHVLKTDRDGKHWELVSVGFRNHYDAAFDRDGELFTFDSDMEWDINAPWYRPTRVCHVTSGSEFGWRSGSGKWPTYYPDSLPPTCNVGPGSPTGVTFGYGAKFPTRDQEALFLCDWSYGKLYAMHRTPVGSSYVGEVEEFASGLPLPLTDIVVNPVDGAMYFTIGGRKTTSGLYRIIYTGNESTARPSGPAPGGEARSLRHKLESFHGKKAPAVVDEVWPYLGHEDRFIRFAARTALEHQDIGLWQGRAQSETEPQAGLTALLAVAHLAAKSDQSRLLAALERWPWEILSDAQRLDLLRVYGLSFVRMGGADADTRSRTVARLAPHFPARSRELNSELCKLLCYLQADGVAAKALALVKKAPTQEEQMDYIASLRNVTSGWTPDLRKQYFEWFNRAAGYRGGASFAGFVSAIKADAVAKLSAAERETLKPIIEAKPSTEPAAPRPRPFVKKWTVEELLPIIENQLTGRDIDKGRDLFATTRCNACHRFGDEGGANGPDLTSAAGRFSVRDLLEAIIEPNKVISDQYSAVTITLVDGKQATGRVVNLVDDLLIIMPDMLQPGALVKVNRNDVESMTTSKISMMPAGLIDTCTADEVKDLLAYLLSRADRNGSPLKK